MRAEARTWFRSARPGTVSLQLKGIGLLPLCRTVPSASLAAPPQEDSMDIGGVRPNGLVVPELGVAPLADSDTALEDELPPQSLFLVRFTLA